ncbi:MAG TPA: prenyltransferase [Candidatus Dormibacteraeota bacterium]|nr:prenyltransferase [Candidatus Dormibacteraeota bacterium]
MTPNAGPATQPRPGIAAVVWQSVRPRSLTVAVLPVLVGTAALARDHTWSAGVALGCLGVAVLLQAGTNAINDAEDAATGADATPTAMPSLALRRGWIDARQARLIGLGALGLAAVLGLALALAIGKPWLLGLGAAGVVVGWAYTAPPLRLAYRPLGELASGGPMGIGITWGTAAAQAGATRVPPAVLWSGAMLAVITAAILHANNARDRESDARIGKRTVATYLSPRGVVLEFRLLLAATAVLLVAGLATRGLPVTCLVALPAVMQALRAAARARPDLDARGWTMLLIACVGLHLLTGVLLAAGLLLHAWV